jgi:hypothetical protein
MRPFAPLILALLLSPAALAAQAAGCPADTTQAGRICQAGADALTLFLPVEASLVSGGNPVPGTSRALGRFGKFRLAGRIGLVQVTIPDASFDGTTDTVRADTRMLVPMPRLDIDVGIFSKKLPVGTASIDLLGSAVVVPMGRSAATAWMKTPAGSVTSPSAWASGSVLRWRWRATSRPSPSAS